VWAVLQVTLENSTEKKNQWLWQSFTRCRTRKTANSEVDGSFKNVNPCILRVFLPASIGVYGDALAASLVAFEHAFVHLARRQREDAPPAHMPRSDKEHPPQAKGGGKSVPHCERSRARAVPFGAAVAALAEESVAVALPEAPDAVELVGSESALVGVSVGRQQPTDAVHLAKAQARRTRGAEKENEGKERESLNRRIER
jgi:hypothetical protein